MIYLPSKSSYYNRNQIQLTILTGIEDYSGLRGWVNKAGHRWDYCNCRPTLNSVKLEARLFQSPMSAYEWKQIKTADDFSFWVLPNLDHGSIVSRFENDDAEITDLTVQQP